MVSIFPHIHLKSHLDEKMSGISIILFLISNKIHFSSVFKKILNGRRYSAISKHEYLISPSSLAFLEGILMQPCLFALLTALCISVLLFDVFSRIVSQI